MFLLSLVRSILLLLIPLTLSLTSYLYLYPVFHQCAFPSITDDAHVSFLNTFYDHLYLPGHNASQVAQFRLLALGDPQLEGDSSIDDIDSIHYPHFFKFWNDMLLRNNDEEEKLTILGHFRSGLHHLIDFYLSDIPHSLEVWRKRLDHFANDYYLAHVYRTMHWWTSPTHTTVLGDLVGSQWIDDDEFMKRGWRYWYKVFSGAERVRDDLAFSLPDNVGTGQVHFLGSDESNSSDWSARLINVAGNHDVGYAGDISRERLDRFERIFGKPNYELRFRLPVDTGDLFFEGDGEADYIDATAPEIRIIVVNDMNLDGPASCGDCQEETYKFLNDMITSSHDVNRPALFTIALTHVPLYKPDGVCVDGPFFSYFTDDHFDNGVQEQNHLSMAASKGFLEGIMGMSGNPSVAGMGLGRNGIILTGHDHEGCDTWHYINQTEVGPENELPEWSVTTFPNATVASLPTTPGVPGVREVTLRSMMGAYGGNAGLLSVWFNATDNEWEYSFATCQMGTQHLWWAVHILILVSWALVLVFVGVSIMEDEEWGMSEEEKVSHRQHKAAVEQYQERIAATAKVEPTEKAKPTDLSEQPAVTVGQSDPTSKQQPVHAKEGEVRQRKEVWTDSRWL